MKDIARLLDFRFSSFGTKGLARLTYGLLFILVASQTILGIAYLLAIAQAVSTNAGVAFLIVVFGTVSIAVASLFLLAFGRVVLEFFVLQFGQCDFIKEQNIRQASLLTSPSSDDQPSTLSFTKVQPVIQEDEWRCRCGTVNEPNTAECRNCKRAPNAIY